MQLFLFSCSDLLLPWPFTPRIMLRGENSNLTHLVFALRQQKSPPVPRWSKPTFCRNSDVSLIRGCGQNSHYQNNGGFLNVYHQDRVLEEDPGNAQRYMYGAHVCELSWTWTRGAVCLQYSPPFHSSVLTHSLLSLFPVVASNSPAFSAPLLPQSPPPIILSSFYNFFVGDFTQLGLIVPASTLALCVFRISHKKVKKKTLLHYRTAPRFLSSHWHWNCSDAFGKFCKFPKQTKWKACSLDAVAFLCRVEKTGFEFFSTLLPSLMSVKTLWMELKVHDYTDQKKQLSLRVFFVCFFNMYVRLGIYLQFNMALMSVCTANVTYYASSTGNTEGLPLGAQCSARVKNTTLLKKWDRRSYFLGFLLQSLPEKTIEALLEMLC